ncbi:TetR/AcrR family transcriptional regulator [Blautia sp. An81]|uniref:TetR/AcrR family transcriptional regulator n=1 Tax=Candidatus Blautia merdigallinarum TaxID=2838495 RepID=A0A9D2N635_9FIRM|nr:TetR/AcrR family transcriptional regulator [Blautia sp. An81]OUN29320.1 hypothetical protein B5G33_10805 [Blautia sp. An81]HJC10113.1 TetR/AcrR family transcriptional regulator [Candidatus Blautia merdigallinarum]
MSTEKKIDSKKEEILQIARELFLTQGYTKTSIRQIASKVHISVGLTAYHFKSKREMAVEIVRRIFHRLAGYTKMYVNRHETPVLYSATLICLNYTALSQTPYRSFYEDILREDILLDVLIETGVETYICIRDKYCPWMSDEETEKMGWYGNYVSASMERSLVLYQGMKPLIEGTIPEIILKASLGMWHFKGDVQVIEEAGRKGREIVEKIMENHKNII